MQTGTRETIDALIQQAMTEHTIPGVALAIVENREVAYLRAYGVSSLAMQEPLQVNALFHLASVTKLFVGTALLQLAERGQLDLEATVVSYLPYFTLHDARANALTIRQLMTHTSGMPDTDEYGWETPEYDDGALERYVRSLDKETLIAAPGEKYAYSNIAYEVLGDVIAKCSGMTFEDYVAQNLLRPLGMKDSTLLVRQANPMLLTTPHTVYNVDRVTVSDVFPYNRAHAPSSTLYSNVPDLSRFAIACLNRGELDGVRILKSETVEAMWTRAFVKPSEFWSHVGLTWNIGTRKGHHIVGHGGEDVGFSTSLVLVPDDDVAVIYLTNSDGTRLEPTGDAILDLLLK